MGRHRTNTSKERENKNEIDLIDTLLGDDPRLIVDVLLDALRQGMSAKELAGMVTYAPLSNHSV